MNASTAYVFDTLSTAHGSAILPGEDVAERSYLALGVLLDAIDQGDAQALCAAATAHGPEQPEVATAPLRQAIDEMDRLIAEAEQNADHLCSDAGAAAQWIAQVGEARSAVERKSIELRIVASAS